MAIHLLLDFVRLEVFEMPARRGPATWTPFRQLGRFRIINQLNHVTFTLGTIIAGVAAIANQTQTVPPVVSNVNNNLTPVRAKADALAGRAGGSRRGHT